MDLDSFITKYRPEWTFLERACAGGSRGLAKLSGEEIGRVVDAYLRASAHLAEARTRYRDPPLHEYLNALVAKAHAALYSSRARTVRGFLRAFGSRYREALRRTAPYIAIAAAILIGVSLATMWWVATSAEARAGLLPSFANEAIERAGGDRSTPVPGAHLSTFILLNNVQVSFLAFAGGILAGVGTLYVLVQNALLLGTLAGAFQAAGHGWSFWSLVLPHGLLELTAICIAAGAGLRMGWILVDPGDRRRGAALAEEARDSVTVLVGVIPAFAVAAAIEGFLTGSDVPTELQIGIGAAAAALYIWLLFGSGRRPRVPGVTPGRSAATADRTL